MTHRPRLGGLIVGLLLTACLSGGVYATLRFNIGGIRYLPPQASTHSSLEPDPVSPFTGQYKTKDIGADTSRRARTRQLERRPTQQQGPRNIMAPEKGDSEASTISPGLSAEVIVSPVPDRKTLKPIGYVQKANGLVEAIVSEGDGVQVVHVGDVVEEKYTVAQISPEAVEIVAFSASPNVLPSAPTIASNSTPGIRKSAEASALSGKPFPRQAALSTLKRVADSKGRPGLSEKSRVWTDEPEHQASVPQADSSKVVLASPTLNSPKPIGYVEMQAGTRITVIPDGESVRLLQPEVALAGRREIEKGSEPVKMASAPGLAAPKQAESNLNRSMAQPVLPVDNATPNQALRTISDKIASSQHAPQGNPLEKRGTDDRPLVTSASLGFVEKADGRVQAIIDDGEGIHFVQMDRSVPETLIAGMDSAKAAEGAHPSQAPTASSPVRLASGRVDEGPPPGLSLGARQSFPPSPAETADASRGEDSALAGPLQPWEPPDRPPPKLETPIADDRVVPDRSPPEDEITASIGLEAEVASSSQRDEAVLGSLGYLNTQNSRASPPMASSEPAAAPRGSPASDTSVLRSFGYGDWQYGRASPLAVRLEGAARANGSAQRNTIVIKPIGYLDWQDGRVLAVVDDGDDGVRLIHEGELLDDNRFRAVRVNPETVEIAEIPITRPGLPGDHAFQPYGRQRTASEAPLQGPLKEPHGSLAEDRLVSEEGQFSYPVDRPARVPYESSLAVPGFALRSQSVPCFDFKSLMTIPTASPRPWSFFALNLCFPLGTSPAFSMAASANCAGAVAY